MGVTYACEVDRSRCDVNVHEEVNDATLNVACKHERRFHCTLIRRRADPLTGNFMDEKAFTTVEDLDEREMLLFDFIIDGLVAFLVQLDAREEIRYGFVL